MADEPGARAISQVAVWAFRGRLITDMTHEELLSAMADCCDYAARLEQALFEERKINRPAAFKYVKDIG